METANVSELTGIDTFKVPKSGVYKKKMSCVTHVRHLILTT